LRAVPGDAFSLFALPVPDGADTLARLLRLADAYIVETGAEMPLPSKGVAELEKGLNLRLGRDILAKIHSAAAAVHLVNEKEFSVYPVIILEAVSDVAAKDLEKLVPRLRAAGGKRSVPRQHTIDGQCVRSLTDKPADASLMGLPPHYGRRGKFLVLGWHRGRVASTLDELTKKKDLLNLQNGLASVDAEGPVSALGLFSCRQLLAHLAHIGSTAPNQSDGHRRELGYLREMGTPMAKMPPTLFTIKRLADGMRIEFRQSELPVASATVIDVALTWMVDTEAAPSLMNFLFARQGPAPAGAVPAPAAPPLPAAGPAQVPPPPVICP